jgi:16S rRNA (guanine527-N7)-methyltransferase
MIGEPANLVYGAKMYFNQRTPLMTELGFRAEAIPKLKSYVDLLWAANEELNLFSRQVTYEELIDNHILDCLLPLKLFPAGAVKAAADFGAGGGLPGVIYAIQFPDIAYHLFEKSPKKQEFLNRCKSLAPNLQVHAEIPKKLTGIDLVTARAFKPLDVILEMSRDYYQAQGKYFLLKGRREKIDEEIALATKKFKELSVEIRPLKSPVLEVERHLILI